MTPYEKYKNHPFLPLYERGNVPFDEEDSIWDKLFMIPYLAEHPTGGAVVVFPGGGYRFNDNDIDNTGSHAEASDIAEFLYNKEGISVFVVNYRTEKFAPHIDYRGLMSDGLRAVRTVRHRAAEFGIDPQKIAVMGFSAGGHLASMMLTKYDFVCWDEHYVKDEIDLEAAEPQAAVLGYAVSTFDSKYSHGGTRRRFTHDDETLFATFSADKNITEKTAPTFIWHTRQDGTVPCTASINLAKAMELHHVDYELHIFNINVKKHDIGIGQGYLNSALWPIESLRFLKEHGFSEEQGSSAVSNTVAEGSVEFVKASNAERDSVAEGSIELVKTCNAERDSVAEGLVDLVKACKAERDSVAEGHVDLVKALSAEGYFVVADCIDGSSADIFRIKNAFGKEYIVSLGFGSIGELPIDGSRQIFSLYRTGSLDAVSLLTIAEEVWKPQDVPFELHGFCMKNSEPQGSDAQDIISKQGFDQLLAWLKQNELPERDHL